MHLLVEKLIQETVMFAMLMSVMLASGATPVGRPRMTWLWLMIMAIWQDLQGQ